MGDLFGQQSMLLSPLLYFGILVLDRLIGHLLFLCQLFDLFHQPMICYIEIAMLVENKAHSGGVTPIGCLEGSGSMHLTLHTHERAVSAMAIPLMVSCVECRT